MNSLSDYQLYLLICFFNHKVMCKIQLSFLIRYFVILLYHYVTETLKGQYSKSEIKVEPESRDLFSSTSNWRDFEAIIIVKYKDVACFETIIREDGIVILIKICCLGVFTI